MKLLTPLLCLSSLLVMSTWRHAAAGESPATTTPASATSTTPPSQTDPSGGKCSSPVQPYDATQAKTLAKDALDAGDPHLGLELFCSERLACLSCHRIGKEGGDVGPALADVGKRRTPQQIVESVLWPEREVPAEYQSWFIL